MNTLQKKMENRKEFLINEMKKQNIEILIVYSNSDDFGFDLALNKIKPILFHYYFLEKSGKEGFLEIDYLVEDLKNKFKGEIISFDERNPEEEITNFLKKYSKIAIGGNAPWKHLSEMKKELIEFNKELNEVIKEKEKEEIKKIKVLANKTSKIIKKIEKSLKRKNQKEIESLLRQEFLKEADKLAFPICITSGKDIENTTATMPTNKKILKKDIICVDAGIVRDGFQTDCTRMFFINNPPANKNYQELLTAHNKVIKKIKEGTSIKELVSIYEKELEKENLPLETLEKADLGHSIGFKLHEDPIFFKEGQEEILKENMIITLEPEIKVDNYKLRVEDMVLIGKNKSRILTK